MFSDYFDIYFVIQMVAAFFLVVCLVMPFRKLARVLGIVDAPGGRKQHDKAIPPIGGIIVFSTFMVFGVAVGIVDMHSYWPLYMSLVVLLVSGALDDQFSLSAGIKFFVHLFCAGFIALLGNVQAAYLGDLFGFGVMWTGFMSYPFTIIAIVLLINSMNLIDGMDGLAGGISVVMFFWFALAAVLSGWYAQAQVMILLSVCVCGFLVFNIRNPWRRRASLFLGDAGSMSLGLIIAWFAVHLARGPLTPLEPIAVAWIIGFPIFDTCAQFYRRICNGQDPFSPDRGHFHHHFIDAGVPVHWAAPVIIMIVALMGAVGYFGTLIGVPNVILTCLWLGCLFGHILMSRKPERYIRLIQKVCGRFCKNATCSSSCVDKG